MHTTTKNHNAQIIVLSLNAIVGHFVMIMDIGKRGDKLQTKWKGPMHVLEANLVNSSLLKTSIARIALPCTRNDSYRIPLHSDINELLENSSSKPQATIK